MMGAPAESVRKIPQGGTGVGGRGRAALMLLAYLFRRQDMVGMATTRARAYSVAPLITGRPGCIGAATYGNGIGKRSGAWPLRRAAPGFNAQSPAPCGRQASASPVFAGLARNVRAVPARPLGRTATEARPRFLTCVGALRRLGPRRDAEAGALQPTLSSNW